MPPDQYGERTEQPTQRRRQEVRRRGQVARSVDLNAAVVLLGSIAALALAGSLLGGSLGKLLRNYLGGPAWLALEATDVNREFTGAMLALAEGLLPVLLILAAAALASNLLQVGFLASGQALKPDLARISPLKGVRRILSLQGLVRLVVSLLKVTAIAVIAAWITCGELPLLAGLTAHEPPQIARFGADAALGLAWKVCAVLVVLAVLDFSFQKWQFEQEIRMTRQELRDELREMEGDPQLRMRRRQVQRQIAMQRMAQQVPESDVVITNPTELAIALKYKPDEMDAPEVVAKGAGHVAQRIRQIAAGNGIPIVEKRELAQALYRSVEPGQQIPADLYEAVAEVLAYVYQLRGETVTAGPTPE